MGPGTLWARIAKYVKKPPFTAVNVIDFELFGFYKQIVSGLTKIFEDLDTVADYSQRHLPAFVMEAVQMIFWISMIVRTLDNDHRNVKNFRGQRPYSLLLFLVSQLLHYSFSSW